MIILPIIALLMMYQYMSCKVPVTYGEQLRAEAWFRAIVLFEAVILVLTNVLSVFHILTRNVDFIAWLLIICVFAFLYGKNKKDGTRDIFSVKKALASIGDESKYTVFIMLALLAVLAAVLLFGTIFTVPYNYDSMTYHLARIGYWMDHKSVAHYITNIDRQVYSPVLAEYNLLHIMLLCGNDTFANFLQYFCMFAAAYYIYGSARKLGTSKVFSVFGAFIFMMMPLTISQSITTQNDLFAALMFILFVYKLIDVIEWKQICLNKGQILDIVSLGLLVAYAYLAKTSVCASMVMFMPWLAIVRIAKKDKVKYLIGSVGIAIVSIVVPISETLIRTYLSSGSLMTSTASGNIMVATKNVKYIIVNILKNFSMLITQNYYRPLNGFIYRIAIGTGQRWNVEVNNEAIAFHGFDFLHHMNMGEDMYSHDKTPSAFVAYLAVLAGGILVVLLVKVLFGKMAVKKAAKEGVTDINVSDVTKQFPLSIGFAISAWLSMGFIMALLRWQPWGTRLMYPALTVTIIMSVNLLSISLNKCKAITKHVVLGILIVLSTMLAIPSVTYNLQPALEFAKSGCENRINQYFRANYRLDGYQKLIELSMEDQAMDIGLIISGDGYDYPLWLMLKDTYPSAKLRHLIKEDADKDTVAPDCIFMVERDVLQVGETYIYAGETYTCVYLDEMSGDSYLRK